MITSAELSPALAAMVSDGMNGLANFQGGLSLANRQLIVDFAAQQKLPAVYQATLFAEAGGLMSSAPDLAMSGTGFVAHVQLWRLEGDNYAVGDPQPRLYGVVDSGAKL